jgi:hypothetical protein
MPDNRYRTTNQPVTLKEFRKKLNLKAKELGLNEPKNFVFRMGINSSKGCGTQL